MAKSRPAKASFVTPGGSLCALVHVCCLVASVLTTRPALGAVEPRSGSQPDIQRVGAKFDRIAHEMEAQHAISANDKAYVLKMFDGRFGFQRVHAFLCLMGEVENGLLSRERFISLVQPKLLVVPGREAGSYFAEVAEQYLGLKGGVDPALRSRSHDLRDSDADEGRVSQAQRAFIASALQDRSPRNRVLAGVLFIQKRNLAGASRLWVLRMTDKEVAQSRGSERRAWEIVRRTVRRRNPDRPPARRDGESGPENPNQ